MFTTFCTHVNLPEVLKTPHDGASATHLHKVVQIFSLQLMNHYPQYLF